MNKAMTVSELNRYIKGRFDSDGLLSSVMVTGEISNYKLYPSGHHYFSLKDAGGQLKCVLFKGNAYSLKGPLSNGMQVEAAGNVSCYERDGVYQLYVRSIRKSGEGDLQAAFEALKAKLESEGLFADNHKKTLPKYPKKIAVITSPAGAAVRDVLRILKNRWPATEVVVVPVRVQGEEAPEEIARAIREVNRMELADLIITGRGGGSLEDLWAFNTETVARAIFDSVIPVISAVGHEPDVTIADFVADRRAATPSNAAELAVQDQTDLRRLLQSYASKLDARKYFASTRLRLDELSEAARNSLNQLLQTRRTELSLRGNAMNSSLSALLSRRRKELELLSAALNTAVANYLQKRRSDLALCASSLDALSPLRVLSRGFTMTEKDGAVLSSCAQLSAGDVLDVIFTDGRAACEVRTVTSSTE